MSEFTESVGKSLPGWAGNVVILLVLTFFGKSYFDDKLSDLDSAGKQLSDLSGEVREMKGTQTALASQMQSMVTALEKANHNQATLEDQRARILRLERCIRDRRRCEL